jgi:superfamily II DNA or RNA helicase
MPPIPVILTNRHAQFLCNAAMQARLKEFYSYAVPGAEYSEMVSSGEWDGRRNMMSRGRIGAGLFVGMWKAAREAGFHFLVKDQRAYAQLSAYAVDPPGIRPYQQEAVTTMLKASNMGGLVLCATGVGKTFLSAVYLRHVVGCAVFVCDELTLLTQSQRELEKVLQEKIGVVGRSEFKPARVTVATVQTLHLHRRDPKFLAWYAKVDCVVIDEIHVALNRRNIDVVRIIKPKAVFGLTATLEMHKPNVAMEAMALTGPVIFRYSIQTGVAEGYLTQGRVVRVMFDDSTHRGWAGSPEAEYRLRITCNQSRNECITALAREGVKAGHRVIVLAERIQHLKTLSRMLSDTPHRLLHGAYSHQERFAAKEAMDAGTLPLILASRIFSKGIDIRKVDVIVDAAAMSGRNGVIQKFGRGVRVGDGKTNLLFLDIADRGNHFEDAARARLRALKELGVKIVDVMWGGNASVIYGSD